MLIQQTVKKLITKLYLFNYELFIAYSMKNVYLFLHLLFLFVTSKAQELINGNDMSGEDFWIRFSSKNYFKITFRFTKLDNRFLSERFNPDLKNLYRYYRPDCILTIN